MSAWLCNEEHIYELAHYYVNEVAATTMSVAKVAKLLYDANVSSLVCRYGDKASDMPMEVLSHYHPIVTNPLHMASFVNCYAYQSCECNEWEDSTAYNMCQQMLESLNLPKDYHLLDEYNAAPWGFEAAEYKKVARIIEIKKQQAALKNELYELDAD